MTSSLILDFTKKGPYYWGWWSYIVWQLPCQILQTFKVWYLRLEFIIFLKIRGNSAALLTTCHWNRLHLRQIVAWRSVYTITSNHFFLGDVAWSFYRCNFQPYLVRNSRHHVYEISQFNVLNIKGVNQRKNNWKKGMMYYTFWLKLSSG